MSKGRARGEVEGDGEGEGKFSRVVLDAVELATEVVDGGEDMLVGSMVRVLMTSAASSEEVAREGGREYKRKKTRKNKEMEALNEESNNGGYARIQRETTKR